MRDVRAIFKREPVRISWQNRGARIQPRTQHVACGPMARGNLIDTVAKATYQTIGSSEVFGIRPYDITTLLGAAGHRAKYPGVRVLAH